MKSIIKRIMLLIALFSLSACGGAIAGAGSTKLSINMQEFMFAPTEISIPAGQEISLKLINEGAILHEFVILKKDTSVSMPFNEDDEEKVYWELEVEAGQSVSSTFLAPSEPGEYQIICGISGHMEAGMVGTLIVLP